VDVIPGEFLGRLNGTGSVVGSFTGMIFSAFIYGKLQTQAYVHEVYLGAALLYLVGMGLMCWRVREGQYPPPTDEPPRPSRLQGLVADIRTYARECFCHPIYISFYIYNMFSSLANAGSFAVVLFYVYHLGFSMDRMGKFGAMLSLIAMGTAIPIGWLVDRLHPIRAMLLAAICAIPLIYGTYFMRDFAMYMVITALRSPISQLGGIAAGTLCMRLLPKKQYGQFCSANDLVCSAAMMVGSLGGGLFIQHFHHLHGNAGYGYFWLWAGSFQTAALACLFIVYLYWRKMGAENFSFDPETSCAQAAP
jgi:MFS-type transporter involved in bile tolerance (Atg22 family)